MRGARRPFLRVGVAMLWVAAAIAPASCAKIWGIDDGIPFPDASIVDVTAGQDVTTQDSAANEAASEAGTDAGKDAADAADAIEASDASDAGDHGRRNGAVDRDLDDRWRQHRQCGRSAGGLRDLGDDGRGRG